jgi:gluconate 5-dehydrogenase
MKVRMKNPFSLKGETALITGGGTGLGFGIASSFVRAGARAVLVGRRAGVLEKAARQLGKAATFEPHDVTRFDDNAGVHLKKPALDTTPAEFDAVLQTHVVAAFSLTRAVLPAMVRRKHGNILFTASMASLFGIPLVLAYATAKSAYLGMLRTQSRSV